jgi:hypothetical protein
LHEPQPPSVVLQPAPTNAATTPTRTSTIILLTVLSLLSSTQRLLRPLIRNALADYFAGAGVHLHAALSIPHFAHFTCAADSLFFKHGQQHPVTPTLTTAARITATANAVRCLILTSRLEPSAVPCAPRRFCHAR